MENVTIRKKYKRKSLSQSNLLNICTQEQEDLLNSSILDVTSCSLSSITKTHEEYSEEIEDLKTKLLIADKEIEDLNYENNTLKSTLDLYRKQIDLLKKFTTSESFSNKLVTTPLRRRTLNTSLIYSTYNKGKQLKLDMEEETEFGMNTEKNIKLYSKLKESNEELREKSNDTIKSQNDYNQEIINQNNTNQNFKKKIYILSDEQGRGLRIKLQKLVGPEYQIICIWKQNATFQNVANSIESEIKTLTENDIVIILSGTHDKSPFSIKSNLKQRIQELSNTNVIVGAIPWNKTLNKNIINKTMMNICKDYKYANFLDMGYDKYIPRRKHFTDSLSRSLLREILRIDYKNKINLYLNQCRSCYYKSKVTKYDKYTQTYSNSSDKVYLKKYDTVNQNENDNLIKKSIESRQDFFRL